MRIVRDDGGELIKGIKTPLHYKGLEDDVGLDFKYHLFVWLVDWEATGQTTQPYRYYISITAVSLELQCSRDIEKLIESRQDTKNPQDYWGMVCDLLANGTSAVLWEEDGDDKAQLLNLASDELALIPSTKWAEYNYCGSRKPTIDQLRGIN